MFLMLLGWRHVRTLLQSVLLCGGFVLLSACTTTSPLRGELDSPLWQQRQAQLMQLDDWSFNGRVAVRVEGNDGNNDGWNATLHWQQQGEQYDIRLSGAFGQGSVQLHGDAVQAVMTMADQAPQTAPSVEALMQEQLGWYVPVAGLRYWLTGRPGPDFIDHREVDLSGRLLRLEQDGWQVVFQRYMSVDEMIELPRKLELSNPRLRVRLVIDQWQLTGASRG